ncbi:MAG: hypothetical protein K2J32_04945 [Ruminococcus sp.]|nr:hypothetical protein [Ruminococcus sp.]
MKKIISTLIASLMAVSTFTAVSVSASNVSAINKYTISTSTVENDTVVEEATIPAGSVAITVNINNNLGFTASATKLNVGELADVVVDEAGRPVVTKGDVLGDDFITASAVKNGTVVVSSASAKKTNTDGEMFTIYIADNYSGVSVKDITNEPVLIETDTESEKNAAEAYRYKIGNINNDRYIDAVDASILLGAIEDFKNKYPDKNPANDFTVAFADAHINEYFTAIRSSKVADTNKNNLLTVTDARNISQFYAYVSTGYTSAEAYAELSAEEDNYCSEVIIVTFYN